MVFPTKEENKIKKDRYKIIDLNWSARIIEEALNTLTNEGYAMYRCYADKIIMMYITEEEYANIRAIMAANDQSTGGHGPIGSLH